MAAPARRGQRGTPRELVTRLNCEIDRIVRTDEARKVIAAASAEKISASPEEFASQLRQDRQRFGERLSGRVRNILPHRNA